MTEYIEKDVVINDIGELFTICYETLPNEYGHRFIVEEELQTHLDFVKNLPAADVKPVVHGEWWSTPIEQKEAGHKVKWDYRYPDCPAESCYCSICGDWLTASDEYPVIGRFCPNCGADMRGGEDA